MKFKALTLATLALFTSLVAVKNEAQAHGNVGAGIALGIIGGVVVGSIIANSRPRYYRPYYYRPYYGPRYYYGPRPYYYGPRYYRGW